MSVACGGGETDDEQRLFTVRTVAKSLKQKNSHILNKLIETFKIVNQQNRETIFSFLKNY